jgi:hypothetical protein
MFEIGQAANGYVIECRVPIKSKKREDAKNMISEYPGSCEKQFIAKTMEDVSTLISKLLPMMDDSFNSEEEFDKAFDKAAGVAAK